MKLLFCLILCCIFYANNLFAQKEERYERDQTQEQQEYQNEFSYGLNWNTNASFLGGINLKYGWQRKNIQNQYHFISLEIVSVVHPRELSAGTYIRQKAASFFVFRPSFGREIILFNKAQEEGVQISWMNAAGLSLGYLKPYYVLYQTIPGDPYSVVNIRYTEKLNEGNIVGSGGYFNGFNEMVNYTGVHYKTSINFEYGKFRSSVAGVEIGVMFELMPKEIVLIYKAENSQFFTSLFVNLYLGMR